MGVAPCYRKFPLGVRLRNDRMTSSVMITDADIREWLPGDSLCDGSVTIPTDMPAGAYELQLGLLRPGTAEPAIKLANAGRQTDGRLVFSRDNSCPLKESRRCIAI